MEVSSKFRMRSRPSSSMASSRFPQSSLIKNGTLAYLIRMGFLVESYACHNSLNRRISTIHEILQA